MNVLKWILRIVLLAVIAFAVFLLAMTLTEYTPEREEVLYTNSKAQPIGRDTLRLMSWNIGYAGLDAGMDFFYDGGKRTQQSEEQTEVNLAAIRGFLHANKDSVDIFLLQEVDISSKRSYDTDQLSTIAAMLPSHIAIFAHNYHVGYVPIPVAAPMGKVESGIGTFSRFNPSSAVRYSYPSQESFPYKVFSLKRCFLLLRYPLVNGRELVVVNTHNSAFDDGSQRQAELLHLREVLLSEYNKGNYVIAGGDWNQKPPTYVGTDKGTEQFTPVQIDSALMPSDWQWVFDGKTSSNRYTYEPYVEGQTQTTLLDFFLCSPNVEVLWVRTLDLGFAHSDHNPVRTTVVIPSMGS